tara:strand:+ start:793 stop:978 length:186 start_codon:yes stop_codon:yes gene_type:complete
MKITKVINSRDEKTNNVMGYIVTIKSKDFGVPLDTANRHYQAVQEWLKIDGNTIGEVEKTD